MLPVRERCDLRRFTNDRLLGLALLARTTVNRQWQRIDDRDDALQARVHSGQIDLRQSAQAIEVTYQHLVQRDELRVIAPGQPNFGRLERQHGALDVGRELQLLCRQRYPLFDLGQHPFVAIAGQIPVEFLQRLLLVLRLAELRLKFAELALQRHHLLLRFLDDDARFLRQRVALGEPKGHLFLRIGQANARLDPLPDGNPHRQQREDQPRVAPGVQCRPFNRPSRYRLRRRRGVGGYGRLIR